MQKSLSLLPPTPSPWSLEFLVWFYLLHFGAVKRATQKDVKLETVFKEPNFTLGDQLTDIQFQTLAMGKKVGGKSGLVTNALSKLSGSHQPSCSAGCGKETAILCRAFSKTKVNQSGYYLIYLLTLTWLITRYCWLNYRFRQTQRTSLSWLQSFLSSRSWDTHDEQLFLFSKSPGMQSSMELGPVNTSS